MEDILVWKDIGCLRRIEVIKWYTARGGEGRGGGGSNINTGLRERL